MDKLEVLGPGALSSCVIWGQLLNLSGPRLKWRYDSHLLSCDERLK